MKDDVIYRQGAIDALTEYGNGRAVYISAEEAFRRIEQLPSAQPEIVKCKKCRYVYYDEEFGNYWCNRMSDSFKVEADGYCKWGK